MVLRARRARPPASPLRAGGRGLGRRLQAGGLLWRLPPWALKYLALVLLSVTGVRTDGGGGANRPASSTVLVPQPEPTPDWRAPQLPESFGDDDVL